MTDSVAPPESTAALVDAEAPKGQERLTLDLLPMDSSHLSAVCQHGDCLFLAGDEDDIMLRLTSTDGHHFGQSKRLLLDTILDRGHHSEADIEGMCSTRDEHGAWLWLIGSHSATRRSFDDVSEPGAVVRRPGRQMLARIPIDRDDHGLPTPVKQANDGRMAGVLKLKRGKSPLIKALRRDPRVKPFLKLPAKDNGLDIEGIAVVGHRVLLGCRGPLIGGRALLIDLTISTEIDGSLRLVDGADGLRLHWLDLDGLGIRDLLVQGADLLILAGSTLVTPAAPALFRWPAALRRLDEPMVPRTDLLRYSLPAGDGSPEGLTLFHWPGQPERLLLINDGGQAAASLLPIDI